MGVFGFSAYRFTIIIIFHAILVLFVTISAKSLKHCSSASCVNINWSYPFEHVQQLDLLIEASGLSSDELDTVAAEFSEVLNDPLVS